MARASNIHRLAIKELWSLARDPMMLVLIAYTFTVAIYIAATAMPETLHKAPIAIVDEDRSPLSMRLGAVFQRPHFNPPAMIPLADMDRGMDAGVYTFVLDIPPDFQRDVLAGHSPALQLNVDATRMSQAFAGSGYIRQMLMAEVGESVVRRGGGASGPTVEVALRSRFNPNLERSWFGALMEIVNNVTLVSIILAGAALIREREHGTIEHLLAMPVTPGEIMLAKIGSMGMVVLGAAAFALVFVVQGVLHVPIRGSILLFLAGVGLHLFATASMGLFMATISRGMPEFGMLAMLVLLPLQLLSGNTTPRESMPGFVQNLMLVGTTTHFVSIGQAILFRGAGIEVVWPAFAALLVIGSTLFALTWYRFRSSLGRMI